MHFYQRVRARIYQVRVFSEQESDREYWTECLDLSQVLAALQLHRIPENEWQHYADSAEFLFAVERDMVNPEDYPEPEDGE